MQHPQYPQAERRICQILLQVAGFSGENHITPV